jgi:hypothetical protein
MAGLSQRRFGGLDRPPFRTEIDRASVGVTDLPGSIDDAIPSRWLVCAYVGPAFRAGDDRRPIC